MCPSTAHPRSGLAPMMPTRILLAPLLIYVFPYRIFFVFTIWRIFTNLLAPSFIADLHCLPGAGVSAVQRQVLEPHGTPRNVLAVLGPAHGDLPQLLYAPLEDRLGDHVDPPRADRAEEVGRVVHADRELALVQDSGRRSDAGHALRDGGVYAAVHYAPGRVVFRSQFHVASDLRAAAFLED